MAGRRSDADDATDARIRLSQDTAGRQSTGPADEERPQQPQLSQSQPSQSQPPRPTIHIPQHARRTLSPTQHQPSPLRTSNLYTIDSNTDTTSQAAERGRKPVRGRGRAGAGTGVSPIGDEEPATSTSVPATHLRRPLADGDDASRTRRLPRPSGVSFVEPQPTPSPSQSRIALSDIDVYEGPLKGPSVTAQRVTDVSDTLANYRDWAHRQRERQRARQQRWMVGPYERMRSTTYAWYHKYIIEGLLRQRPLPPSIDGRHVPLDPGRARHSPFLDERRHKPYISNFIRSSRYTVWDFLPKQLIFQFMKLANFYFLIISILQMIPGLSTTGTYTTIIPLLFFVAISMGKEGYDDYRRYRLDKIENRSIAYVLDPGHTVKGESRKLNGARFRPFAKHGVRARGSPLAAEWEQKTQNRQQPATGETLANFTMGNDDMELEDESRLASAESRTDSPSAASQQAGPQAGPSSGSDLEDLRNRVEDIQEEDLELGMVETGFGDRMPWAPVKWEDIRVGDIVRLQRDENVPADIVLLHATGPNGVAYIETMALDGETNLKTKQACSILAGQCDSLAGMDACDAVIVSEDPNLDLYNYDGRVIANGRTAPLTLNQIIFRGSTVRNTTEAIGIVVNSGEECKIRMNAHKHNRAKAPKMQFVVNRIVLLLVVFVVLLSVGCTAGNGNWNPKHGDIAWYLQGADVPVTQILFAFIIMFNTLIPLSLYVSLEIIKVGQFIFMQDIEMYDAETDTPMVANTTTILENLGQVSYIFSDKTGTLTENKMRFRKMSVAGTAWLHDMDVVRDEEEKERKRQSNMLEKKSAGLGKGKGFAKKHSVRRRHANQNLSTASTEPLSPVKSKQSQRPETPPSPTNAQAPMTPLLASGGGFNPMEGRKSMRSFDVPRRSVSTWRSTARPAHAPTELKTEDLIEYIRHRPHTAFSRKARHFILCIALCHTCLPETMDDGHIEFQAASPDELALVQAARDLGYLLVDRPSQSIKLQFVQLDGSPITETYQVLDVVEFSSKRKRMSIVIRMPDGRICMLCKGADSAILPRLKLSQMAMQKASAVERRASKRRSVEQERAMARRSTNTIHGPGTPRSSLTAVRAASMHQIRALSRPGAVKRSADFAMSRRSWAFSGEMDDWLTRREREDLDVTESGPVRKSTSSAQASSAVAAQRHRSGVLSGVVDGIYDDSFNGMVDESLAVNEGAIFDKCFQHIDDFATEGLRTLLYAYRYIEEEDYRKWKAIYQEATTSLANRQERIEAAAELLEQNFDLAGATAIEDKLQQGVPETIDKMRRANIKIWMLTGDKRETAINIAHAARICKPFSEVYILDAAADGDGLQDRIASTLADVGRGMVPHSVVVIDGHTLSVVEADEDMQLLFFDLVARVDSVICCRASPSQKATLVKCIRQRVPSSITLAIGDGANDIAMIQASHVGIGISGREGLQAARISDYSIAQFRFLQRLLLVHGRWNYIRTGKYILATFWKEMVFYLVQALYQHYNGYTGTSLYESTSLTVFNTLFTSLPVILLGIFEKDLRADTLLAVPELYSYGQKSQAFCFRKYVGWMVMAVTEAVIIYYVLHGLYVNALFTIDTTLYAMGSLAFTVCVVFINIKMLVLEMHNQTIISAIGLLVSVGGWFLWSLLLSLIFKAKPGPYLVRHSFLENFGRSVPWWVTVLVGLIAVVALELIVAGLRRAFWSTDQDIMQEVEHYDTMRAVLKEHAAENGEAGGVLVSNDATAEAGMARKSTASEMPRQSMGAGSLYMTSGNDAGVVASPVGAVPPPVLPPGVERRNPLDAAAGRPSSELVTTPGKGKDVPEKSASVPLPGSAQETTTAQRKIFSPAINTKARAWLSDLGSPSRAGFTSSPVETKLPQVDESPKKPKNE